MADTDTIREGTVTLRDGDVYAELDFYEEGGEQRCMGFVMLTQNGRHYTGSIDRLVHLGTLEDDGWRPFMDTEPEITVSQRLIDRITEWAYSEGY